MEYRLLLKDDWQNRINSYFWKKPFIMQSAFILAEIQNEPGHCTLLLSEFIPLEETDYESRTADGMSFSSRILLDVLQKASHARKSLIFVHSQGTGGASGLESNEYKMIFRISYAYMPFGIHASLCFTKDGVSGRIWHPTLSTNPLSIICNEERVCS
jgi:hypothetical protein